MHVIICRNLEKGPFLLLLFPTTQACRSVVFIVNLKIWSLSLLFLWCLCYALAVLSLHLERLFKFPHNLMELSLCRCSALEKQRFMLQCEDYDCLTFGVGGGGEQPGKPARINIVEDKPITYTHTHTKGGDTWVQMSVGFIPFISVECFKTEKKLSPPPRGSHVLTERNLLG